MRTRPGPAEVWIDVRVLRSPERASKFDHVVGIVREWNWSALGC